MFKTRACNTKIDHFGARGFELSLCLRNVHSVSNTLTATIPGKTYRLFEGLDSGLKQTLLLIEAAQLHVVESKLGMDTQPRSFQIPGRSLCVCDLRENATSN